MARSHILSDGATLSEIAEQLGMTVEGVRQIEIRALRKCRKWCERKGLHLVDVLPIVETSNSDFQK